MKERIMKRATRTNVIRRSVAALATFGALLPGLSFANHPVLVDPTASREGPDRNANTIVFKTITAALGAMNGGVNQNGTIFVKPGNYLETIMITGPVTIEGTGPGVNIEAFVVPADPRIRDFPQAMMNPFQLQSQPGVIINAPANRTVELRNLVITNWTDCIRVQGASTLLMNNVTCRSNINNGVLIMDTARVAIKDSTIESTGFRVNPMTGNFPSAQNMPGQGDGINIASPQAQLEIRDTTITNNFGQGIRIPQGAAATALEQVDNLLFNNQRSQQPGAIAGGAAAPAAPMMAPAAPMMAPSAPMAPAAPAMPRGPQP
jgi:hypothetical protein